MGWEFEMFKSFKFGLQFSEDFRQYRECCETNENRGTRSEQ